MYSSKFRLKHDTKEQKFMFENLKETRRQNKLMGLAIDRTNEQNKALSDFFEKN